MGQHISASFQGSVPICCNASPLPPFIGLNLSPAKEIRTGSSTASGGQGRSTREPSGSVSGELETPKLMPPHEYQGRDVSSHFPSDWLLLSLSRGFYPGGGDDAVVSLIRSRKGNDFFLRGFLSASDWEDEPGCGHAACGLMPCLCFLHGDHLQDEDAVGKHPAKAGRGEGRGGVAARPSVSFRILNIPHLEQCLPLSASGDAGDRGTRQVNALTRAKTVSVLANETICYKGLGNNHGHVEYNKH